MRCQHPDPDFSHPYYPIHIHVHSSHLTGERPSYLIADSAQSELLRTQQQKTQHQTRLRSCISDHRWKYSWQSSDSHYQAIYISRKHKPCPRDLRSSQPEELIIPQKHTLSLYLGNSCSNELNQTSDAAEDHDHGYQLSATELSEFLCLLMSDSTSSSEHCLLPTHADSTAHKKEDQAYTAPHSLP
jgi:hypothetical protein